MNPRLLLLIPVYLLILHVAQGQFGTWVYDTTDDNFEESAVLDMRSMNEDVAGESGWIYRQGDKLYLPSGEEVRFWGVNYEPRSTVAYQARFLAKMGINMARIHLPHIVINPQTAQTIDETDPDFLDQYWEGQARFKEVGVYSTISYFFVLDVPMQARWGVPGYDEAFLAGQEIQPFGLIFWEPMLQDAYKQWARDLFGQVNPYTGVKMAEDPATAVIEIQNEDSLFFWTFDPGNYPQVQRLNLEALFYDWLVDEYGSIELAQAAWGDYNIGSFSRDDYANGRAEVRGAGSLIAPDGSFNPIETRNRKRIADNVQFLTELQVEFYEEMTDFFRNELGYQGLLVASNWRTADAWNLDDLERYIYSSADIIDRHDYFNPVRLEGGNFPASGTRWYSVPLVQGPRLGPAIYKQVADRASMLSETAWVSLFEYKAEAPFATAAMNAMSGIDVWFWGFMERGNWNNGYNQWPIAVPDFMGQFPGVSLMLRRGDLDEAPTVVREGRSLRSMYRRNQTLLPIEAGFDPARDDPDSWDPEVSGSPIDPITGWTGKVELAFDTDDEYVHPDLTELISLESQTLTSVTGELALDWDTGILTVNTPRAQGATGFLSQERRIELDDVRITMGNDFGTVLVIALDDRPLTQASQVLLQAATFARLTNQELIPWTTSWGGESVEGYEVVELGVQPWRMDNIDANVVLFDERTITDVQVLDTKGYYRESISASSANGGQRIDFPEDAVYMVVRFEAPADYSPVILTKAMQNAYGGKDFSETLRATSGDGQLTWSATGLPTGLTLSADGVVSGRTTGNGKFDVEVTVTDEDGDSDTRTIPIVLVSSLHPISPWSEQPEFDGSQQTAIGWIGGLDFYPWVWSWDFNSWLYIVAPESNPENIFFYLHSEQFWAWTSETYNGWYVNLATNEWTDVNP